MPPPFQLYSSTVDGLAGQQRGYEGLYTDVATANVGRADAANRITFQAYLQQQEQERQAQEVAARQQFNAWSQAQANAENTRQFNVNQASREKQAGQDFALRSRALDIQADRPNPVLERQNQFDYVNAAERAYNGEFETASDITKLFPTLRPEQVLQVLDASKKARYQTKAEFTRLKDAADTLNDSNRMKDYIRLSTEAIDEMPKKVRNFNWAGNAANPTSFPWQLYNYARGEANPKIKANEGFIKDWAAHQAEIAGPVAAMQKDKALMQELGFAGGQYSPPAAPAWFAQPKTATVTAQPFQEGQRVQDKTTGLFYRIRGGVPVPE